MPEKPMTNQEKLSALRNEIRKQGLDGFILPRTDEFQGEFLAPYAERLGWLTGFTGSAGITVILKERAIVLSDGRYTIQLKSQVDRDLYETGNSLDINISDWIETNSAGRIGYDPWLHTAKQINKIKVKLTTSELVPCARNLVDIIWNDQPANPEAEVSLFPDSIAGRTSVQKRKDIDAIMKREGVEALILTQSDSICWLLNVRGRDVSYSPLVLSYAILYQDGVMDWFIDQARVPKNVQKNLAGVALRKMETLEDRLRALKGQKTWIDQSSAPLWFSERLIAGGVLVEDKKDPCTEMKAIKTKAEQDAIRQAHIKDGIAIARFIAWLEAEAPKGNLTEISVAEKLDSFRRKDPDYVGESFATIAGFAENGAIIHYRADEETNKPIKGDGLLLLDSGGQYASGGTTDITRTFAIGTPTEEMRENYTRVLKGHIALSRLTFPEGTTGAQIDTVARQPLWEVGLDYAHGTGHGVGCFLGVHEEAASISPRGNKPLRAGMLLSNEPGYYKEGAYGIRIENLVLVVEKGFCEDTQKQMLGFETITLVPYDNRLIVADMLNKVEREWLDLYQARVCEITFV